VEGGKVSCESGTSELIRGSLLYCQQGRTAQC
jgi:hypothetical protein